MISLLAVMQTGEAIETGIIGAEGLLGGDAPINGHLSTNATVQLQGDALTMPKAQFVDAYHSHPHLRELVNRYQSLLLMQARQNGACHALHSVRNRLCRWLLQSQDMIGSDTFTLTQEILSHMLGVRRTSISIEAHALQEAALTIHMAAEPSNRNVSERAPGRGWAEARKSRRGRPFDPPSPLSTPSLRRRATDGANIALRSG
jgi:hypothetical protein